MRASVSETGLSTEGGKPAWRRPERRRGAFRNYQETIRYTISVKPGRVLPLKMDVDWRLAGLSRLRRLVETPAFVGVIVLKGQNILYERYAADFSAQDHHAAMSISKMTAHLMIGRLVGEGLVDPSQRVQTYLPEAGPGYRNRTVQQVLDMDVPLDFVEDGPEFLAINGSAYDPALELRSVRDVLGSVTGPSGLNPDRDYHYKSSNIELLAWIAEKLTGRSVRELTFELIEAAGMEAPAFCRCDRTGMPTLGGGLILTLRDLARFGLLLARGGDGVSPNAVGSMNFTCRTMVEREAGTRLRPGVHYRNAVDTNGRWFGHTGFTGQRLTVDPEHEIVVGMFNVIENETALDADFFEFIADCAADIIASVSEHK